MELFHDHIFLSRLHFAFTAIFHIIWPVLTIGLSIFLVVMEACWFITRELRYYHHARFWMRLFLLNFAVGVVSGIPMEFQFGTNWSAFSRVGGDIFGHLLGFEASMAFMLEAAFLGNHGVWLETGLTRHASFCHLYGCFWRLAVGLLDNGCELLDADADRRSIYQWPVLSDRHFRRNMESGCFLGDHAYVDCLSGNFPLCHRRHQCLVSVEGKARGIFSHFFQNGAGGGCHYYPAAGGGG